MECETEKGRRRANNTQNEEREFRLLRFIKQEFHGEFIAYCGYGGEKGRRGMNKKQGTISNEA